MHHPHSHPQASPQDYLSQERQAEHYRKQSQREWVLVDIVDWEALVELSSIQCRLSLKEIYEKVSFAPEVEIKGMLKRHGEG